MCRHPLIKYICAIDEVQTRVFSIVYLKQEAAEDHGGAAPHHQGGSGAANGGGLIDPVAADGAGYRAQSHRSQRHFRRRRRHRSKRLRELHLDGGKAAAGDGGGHPYRGGEARGGVEVVAFVFVAESQR